MKHLTRSNIGKVWMALQKIAFDDGVSAAQRSTVRDAMDILDQVKMDMRRAEVYAAGATAKKPTPVFEKTRLGSAEAVTFYDGYASTHPGFVNPYRSMHR